MKSSAVQYTVRGVPAEVDRSLRERAAREHVSINQAILDVLTTATLGRPQGADFSDLVGSWAPDPEFDEVLESQRTVDLDDWR